MSTLVRPYQSADRQAVFQIAADTAYFGDPVEAFLEDRRLFLDAFCLYYPTCEPQYAWVCVQDGLPVGYLLGCADTASQPRRWLSAILPVLARNFLRGEYQLGVKTRHYLCSLIAGRLSGNSIPINFHDYPAHFHLNLANAWRSQGLGRLLLETFLNQLRTAKIAGVHLHTTDYNQAACALYEKMGFTLLGSVRVHTWDGLLSAPVSNRVYGLRL